MTPRLSISFVSQLGRITEMRGEFGTLMLFAAEVRAPRDSCTQTTKYQQEEGEHRRAA